MKNVWSLDKWCNQEDNLKEIVDEIEENWKWDEICCERWKKVSLALVTCCIE